MKLIEIDMAIYADIEYFKFITYPGVRPNTYKVSNFGKIIYASTGTSRAIRVDKDGYHMIGLMSDDDKQLQYRVHRLVAWEFCDNRDIDLIVNHIDNCKSNNYYLNLEWVTISENTLHGYDYGNGKYGTKHYRNKYPEAMIHEICVLIQDKREQGFIYNEIKYKYLEGVNHNKKSIISLIKDIRRRKVWRSITKLYDF